MSNANARGVTTFGDLRISTPQGPFKTRICRVGTTHVATIQTQGNGRWYVKSQDGKRWSAGRGMTTNVMGLHSLDDCIEFVRGQWGDSHE